MVTKLKVFRIYFGVEDKISFIIRRYKSGAGGFGPSDYRLSYSATSLLPSAQSGVEEPVLNSAKSKGMNAMNGDSSAEFHTVRGYQLINQQGDTLTPAMEDYLEMAYRLCMQEQYTRIGRLSQLLHVKPSSASKMIFKLSQLGLLKYERYEIIFLTPSGKEIGAALLRRHNTVQAFLELVKSDDPLEETELIEHSLRPETVGRLDALLCFFTQHPTVKKQLQVFLDEHR